MNEGICLRIKKKFEYCEFPLLGFLYGVLGIILILKFFINENIEFQNGDKDVVGIIYALVSGFVAVMIPLHYTISFDIIGKIHAINLNNKNNSKNKEEPKLILLYYCHVAEGLIYAFGLFGASVMYEEALVVSSILNYNLPREWNKIGILIYTFALLRGLCLNWEFRKKWCQDDELEKINKKNNKYKKYHMITIILSAIIGGVWAGLLCTSRCYKLNGFGVLLLLTIYYIWWVIFRALFAPMTHVKEYLIDNQNKNAKNRKKNKN